MTGTMIRAGFLAALSVGAGARTIFMLCRRAPRPLVVPRSRWIVTPPPTSFEEGPFPVERAALVAPSLLSSTAINRAAAGVGAVLPAWVRQRVDDVALPLPADTVALLWLLVMVTAVTGSAGAGGLLTGLLGGIVVIVVSAAGLALGAGRSTRQVERELPLVLDTVAAGLRSGSSLLRAIDDGRHRASGPLRVDLDRVLALEAAGVALPVALRRWCAARSVSGVQATVAALVLAASVGGGAAAAVDGVASSRRDARAVAEEMTALSTQARASAVVMVAAPLVFVAVTGAADPQSWAFLTSSPLGLGCLGLGVVLDAAGGLWMTWLAKAVS